MDKDYLLQAAAWQDSLLQSYRSLHLTFQSIILAIGIGLFVITLPMADDISRWTVLFLLYCLAWVHAYFSYRLERIVKSRGNDVNFWHRSLISLEQTEDPSKRYFTRFKIEQQKHRRSLEYFTEKYLSQNTLQPEDIDFLIGKGLGHTRRIVDIQLFNGISFVWLLIITIGVLHSVRVYSSITEWGIWILEIIGLIVYFGVSLYLFFYNRNKETKI